MTDRQELSHPLFAAIYGPATAIAERTLLRPHRVYLVDDPGETVLDVGAGTGAMFPYFDAVSLHAIEPDPHMRERAEKKARELGLDVDIRSATAESLPYDDDTFDKFRFDGVLYGSRRPGGAVRDFARTPAGRRVQVFRTRSRRRVARPGAVRDRAALEAGRRRLPSDPTDRIAVRGRSVVRRRRTRPSESGRDADPTVRQERLRKRA